MAKKSPKVPSEKPRKSDGPLSPTKWTREQLETDRVEAQRRFVVARETEGSQEFYEQFTRSEAAVVAAMVATRDLRSVTGKVLSEQPSIWQTLRYFCAPPVSEEDVWTLVGHKFGKKIREPHAEGTAEVLRRLADAKRFPWLAQGRSPSKSERDAAILATTVLLTNETLKTARRRGASIDQEHEVAVALEGAGFTPDPSRNQINYLDDLAPGHFSRERMVDGAKCDVPIRLRDRRLLALECKVSNTPKNSWKRLPREVGGKSATWRSQFGVQVVTSAVLAGVFDLKCLERAQNEQDVAIFWQHDLQTLVEFVTKAR